MTKRFVLVGMLSALAIIIAACGVSPSPSGGGSGEVGEVSGCTYSDGDGLPDLNGCELAFAVENAYPPFNNLDDSGEGVGWDYDTGREICERLNCMPVFTEAAWDGIFPAMAAGEYDVLFDGVTFTEERDETVDFSTPYVTIGQVLLANAGESRWTTADEFAADESLMVATQLGTTNEAAAQDFVGVDRVTSFEDFGLATAALTGGDADAVVIDTVSAVGFMNGNPGTYQIQGEITSDEELALVFPPGSDLIGPFNAALAAMEADGTLQAINDRWFNPQ